LYEIISEADRTPVLPKPSAGLQVRELERGRESVPAENYRTSSSRSYIQ